MSPARETALFVKGAALETENECIERNFIRFTKRIVDKFPSGDQFSAATWKILEECLRGFGTMEVDEAIVKAINTEYDLFLRVEQKLCEKLLVRSFKDVEEFIETAKTITNRRKSRAGRSLENHVSYFLTRAGIPHDVRPAIKGKPDVVIPSKKAYDDKKFDEDRLFLIACKTTFKDRWPQVLKEGKRVAQKNLFTLQKGMAESQLEEFDEADVNVIVPDEYKKGYPKSPLVLSVTQFFEKVTEALR